MGVNLAGVDIILQLNLKIEELESKISNLQNKQKNKSNLAVVPDEKALVVQKSSFELVIIKD